MRTGGFIIENARWLGAGALLAFLSSFGQTYFISVFAGEIRAAFGLSNGQWGGIYTLGTTASAIVMIWAGGLTDRLRVRALGAAVLVLLALACLLMATVSAAWLLPLVIFALRFAGQGMTSHIAVVAMSRWFIASRGKALSVASLGNTAAEALLPLTFVALMVHFDWRLLWILAAVIALAGIPVLIGLLTRERTPQSWASSEQSAGMLNRHWTRNQTFRHSLFWFMVPALLGPPAFNTAFFFHQVHYAGIKGWAHVDLVALFPAYVALVVVAMMVSGWALDKLGTARLIPWFQVPMVAGFTILAVAETLPVAFFGLFFVALTTGANSVLPNAFWAEFFGTRHIGSIKAMAAAVMVFGTAIGPGITGVLIDLGFGLEVQYLFVAAYFVATTVLMVIGVGRARPMLAAPA
jgi:MFS family permease